MCRCKHRCASKQRRQNTDVRAVSASSNGAVVLDSSQAVTIPGVSHQAVDLAFPNGAARELDRPLPGFDDIETAIREFREGQFLVVLDNEDRENEGDLIIAAEAVRACWMFPLRCVQCCLIGCMMFDCMAPIDACC